MKTFNVFFSDTENPEIQKLERVSIITFLFLATIIILGSLMLTLTIGSQWIVTSAAIAGIIGSATAALLSSLSRKATGWELSDGTYIPNTGTTQDKKERFSQRMATFFIFRPFLGIIGGLIVYYGGDLLNLVLETKDTIVEPTTSITLEVRQRTTELENFKRIIFYSLLAGLFAKTLIEILKGVFKSFFGRG